MVKSLVIIPSAFITPTGLVTKKKFSYMDLKRVIARLNSRLKKKIGLTATKIP